MVNTGLDHRLLRAFCAVAEELHFRRAAVRLHATQSGVSQQVRELERRVGAALFRRSRRAVELTEAGAVFHRDARDLLGRADAALLRAREAARGRLGELGVGFIGAATFEALPLLMEEIGRAAPGIGFRLREMTGREQLEALKEGSIDVGLVRGGVRAAGLEVRPLMTEPVVCLLPEGHALARRGAVRIGDLEGERILNLSRDHDAAAHDFYVGLYRAAGFEPDIVHEASQIATILVAVAATGCVALGPAGWRALARRGVVLRPLDEEPAPSVATRLVWNPRRVSQAVRAAIEAAGRVAERRERQSEAARERLGSKNRGPAL